MARNPIKISSENSIITKLPEVLYAIERSDWNRIKQMAKDIKYPKRWFNILGSACFGVTASSIVQVIYNSCNLSENEKWYNDPMIIVFGISIILGIILYLADNERNKSIENAGKEIVTEMENIESKYKNPIEDAASRQQSNNIF